MSHEQIMAFVAGIDFNFRPLGQRIQSQVNRTKAPRLSRRGDNVSVVHLAISKKLDRPLYGRLPAGHASERRSIAKRTVIEPQLGSKRKISEVLITQQRSNKRMRTSDPNNWVQLQPRRPDILQEALNKIREEETKMKRRPFSKRPVPVQHSSNCLRIGIPCCVEYRIWCDYIVKRQREKDRVIAHMRRKAQEENERLKRIQDAQTYEKSLEKGDRADHPDGSNFDENPTPTQPDIVTTETPDEIIENSGRDDDSIVEAFLEIFRALRDSVPFVLDYSSEGLRATAIWLNLQLGPLSPGTISDAQQIASSFILQLIMEKEPRTSLETCLTILLQHLEPVFTAYHL